MKCTDKGITGNKDVAALYSTPDMDRRINEHRSKLDAKTASAGVPFIAKRTELQKGERVTRTIVVMAHNIGEALPKLKRIAAEYYRSHSAPWIINNGDSFYS